MAYPDNTTHRPVSTPWGPSQGAEEIADGITFYTTASHGGFHLSPKRQAAMPGFMRAESWAGGPWYEEDCDWSMVAVVFREHFVKDYDAAIHTLRNWKPEIFERFFGVIVTAADSYKRRNPATGV